MNLEKMWSKGDGPACLDEAVAGSGQANGGARDRNARRRVRRPA